MEFEKEMKKYKKLSPGDRQKKVINLLKAIKDGNDNLENTYNLLKNNSNLPIKMIDEIFQVIIEGTIYQQKLNEKAIKNKINKISIFLEQEKKERLSDAQQAENLLNFA